MADQDGSPRRWYQNRTSRRRFLAGAAALSAGAVVGSRLFPTKVGAAEADSGLHGAELRGMYLTTKDRLAEGRFGTMFKRMSPYAPSDELLTGLAQTMVEPDTSDSFL